jgi:hypothetical protein
MGKMYVKIEIVRSVRKAPASALRCSSEKISIFFLIFLLVNIITIIAFHHRSLIKKLTTAAINQLSS